MKFTIIFWIEFCGKYFVKPWTSKKFVQSWNMSFPVEPTHRRQLVKLRKYRRYYASQAYTLSRLIRWVGRCSNVATRGNGYQETRSLIADERRTCMQAYLDCVEMWVCKLKYFYLYYFVRSVYMLINALYVHKTFICGIYFIAHFLSSHVFNQYVQGLKMVCGHPIYIFSFCV